MIDMTGKSIYDLYSALLSNMVAFGNVRCGFPGDLGVSQEPTYQRRRCRLSPWVRETPWGRGWQPDPGSFPGKTHGQRSLGGPRPWGYRRAGHDLVTGQQQIQDDECFAGY